MKLLLAIFSVLLWFSTSASAAINNEINQEKVIVYNWLDYIPEGVLEEFTKETGIEVEYSTYNSNEIMYKRLKIFKGRGYDVIIPSTNLVARMIEEGLIRHIDHEKIKNFNLLDPNLLNKNFDPNNQFSIPYMWGTTGIGINTKNTNNAVIKSWSDLWDSAWREKLFLIDDVREVFHMALKINDYSTNSSDPNEIREAYTTLTKLMPNVSQITSDPKESFNSDNIALGLVWNGEVAVLQADNPALQYIYPEEGVSLWIDSFVIPARAQNVENAHKFIDYMLMPSVAARCIEELGYASPVLAAKALLSKQVRTNPIIFPPQEVIEKAEFQIDVSPEAAKLYELYWEKLKSGNYY